ncbi:hypothetical protein AYJ56_10525 [Brucella anthropi]|nr:hypothetical protein AYJ56_10525 [Brucella anthropi]
MLGSIQMADTQAVLAMAAAALASIRAQTLTVMDLVHRKLTMRLDPRLEARWGLPILPEV